MWSKNNMRVVFVIHLISAYLHSECNEFMCFNVWTTINEVILIELVYNKNHETGNN